MIESNNENKPTTIPAMIESNNENKPSALALINA